MFDNILVGVDGRGGGRDAVALARQLAGPTARLTLIHVYTGALGPPVPAGAELDTAWATLERERGRAEIPHARLEAVVGRSVGRVLQRRARAERADLIAVGMSVQHGARRLVFGDDARAAMNGAPSAVAIAPPGHASASRTAGRIGVGYDGSAESIDAIAVAAALAHQTFARVDALVVAPLHHARGTEPGPYRRLVLDAQARLAEVPDAGADLSLGDPRQELEEFTREVDLLIVGSRSRGPAGRFAGGSTANHLARHTACPLLVLPRSATRDHLARAANATTPPAVAPA